MNALGFLIEVLFGLALMAVVLRFWLQAARADFYNPVSQTIVKLTNPLLLPLQTFLPSKGQWNIAALLLAFLVAAAKYVVLSLMLNGALNPIAISIISLVAVINEFLTLAFWILIIRAILSWFSQGHNPAELIMMQLTEPFLRPIRNLLPRWVV